MDIGSDSFRALGTTAHIVTSSDSDVDQAISIARETLQQIDASCSRFRDDSELSRVNSHVDSWVHTSDLFRAALRVALRAATISDGCVVPTVGEAMRLIGYDRSFELGPGISPRFAVKAVPGWKEIKIDDQNQRVRVPTGVQLDLGATAKALASDITASQIHNVTLGGVLVSLGGDVATAGIAPDDGWIIGIADNHASPASQEQQRIVIQSGGVATSGVTVRRWKYGTEEMHHIIDPATGAPATQVWKTASVFAESCVDANIASTASIIKGDAAMAWLEHCGLDARLVRIDGVVAYVGNWPRSTPLATTT